VWQLFLPVLAYAHLSKTGALSQEVCTSWGMKTVVMAQSAEPQSEHGALDMPCYLNRFLNTLGLTCLKARLLKVASTW
jgi:hypothetical protein